MVAVEINESDEVIDVRPVETEAGACDTRHHCKVMLHGTVMKIEDSMIFIKTPVVDMSSRPVWPGRTRRPGMR